MAGSVKISVRESGAAWEELVKTWSSAYAAIAIESIVLDSKLDVLVQVFDDDGSVIEEYEIKNEP